MFVFVKKMLFAGLTILSSFTRVNSLICISMNNQECKTRLQVVNVNGDEPLLFPFSIETNVVVVVMSIIRMQKFVFLML